MTGRPVFPDLAGRHVAVTGGASGIGAAIVRAFRDQDAMVTFFDIDKDAGMALEAELASNIRFHRLDLAQTGHIGATFSKAAADRPFDVLINNAAHDDRHKTADVTPKYWRDRLSVNLDHHFFCSQAVIPQMKARGSGVIIHLGSIAWRVGLQDAPAYVTAKAAIEGLSHGLARELGPSGIRVNCVLPGFVRTRRQVEKWVTPEFEAQVLERQCLKRFVMPHDVAAAVVMLASDSAAAITNQTLIVDGGWS
ncbi:SDR family NAD(P)-dependent oxidoreductase [Paracoccus sp. Z330]|uniref:SDR family NAD(P)-dependent oxidoreductase n=1 Tax=Paracoccus onchidii TaxID=3017813 RepID=A0ABT4ZAG5_9RHOB|nr:SDR family oxidoreductase [Paracoccus onchidii]MDB6176349.1 SDR family NAD(P)-dependent oxidoreductase [Paracoccus onchidii]